jgi:hypothetical protein
MPATLQADLVSPERAAEFLGTTPGNLAIWRCQRLYDLPYIKIGRSIRYRQADLEAFVERRTVQPLPAAS